MASALERADGLDPLEIRALCEARYAPERMVADYLTAYGRAIEHVAGRG
jgi:hypothetical protein